MIPECLVPTIKHGGGSVMVWGCFSSAGVGDLVKIEGIMKKEQYKTILENNAIPSGLRTIRRGFVFMQDNHPKHTSKLCKNYIKEQEDNGVLKNMTWPAQLTDLNPIVTVGRIGQKGQTKMPNIQRAPVADIRRILVTNYTRNNK